MTFAESQSPSGMQFAPVDINLTPVGIPAPTINSATNIMAVPAACKVVIQAFPMLTQMDQIVLSMGSIGPSVLTGQTMGTVQRVMGSMKVNLCGNAVTTFAMPETLQNGPGAPGMGIAPAQFVVQILS